MTEYIIVLKGSSEDVETTGKRLKRTIDAEFGDDVRVKCVVYRTQYLGDNGIYNKILIH